MATYSAQDLAGLHKFARTITPFVAIGTPSSDTTGKKVWTVIATNQNPATFGRIFAVEIGHYYAGDPLRSALSALFATVRSCAYGLNGVAGALGSGVSTIQDVRNAYNSFVTVLNQTRPARASSPVGPHHPAPRRPVSRGVRTAPTMQPAAQPPSFFHQPTAPASVPRGPARMPSISAPGQLRSQGPNFTPSNQPTSAGQGFSADAIAQMATSTDPTVAAKGNQILRQMRFYASKGDVAAQNTLAQCRAHLDQAGINNDAF